ncbi:rhomboid family intramembrane serine protease [Vulgatibacter incomptus]|uniref:Rhomboid family serine protease n=1 Tax=Vulgatibacter incomptus TaxID=1391653 RepID=A0A0K1PFF8_9BACT|nr:rhomboid family intramembrane serine protease [Vulgatibacter incomptus]AKU91849.1 rhomboid family serine protease [Vulgatibacter incomptus]
MKSVSARSAAEEVGPDSAGPTSSHAQSLSSTITIRGPGGEETLELEEFEERVERGQIDPASEVRFPPVTGAGWVRAVELEPFRGRYEPRALYFSRAFHLGRIPLLTIALALANVAVFLLSRRAGPVDTGTLLDFGAKAGPLLHDLGELWRLLTANFVHRDWAHLGFNLFVVFHFGAAVENAYRPLDYLLILFAAALGTTTLSYAMTDAASAGASGIAYGMLGAAVVFGLKYRRILPARYRSVLGGAVLPTVFVFLYIGWISSGVDNWGHVGGLVAGATVTALLSPRLLGDPPGLRSTVLTRIAPLAFGLLAVLAGGAVLRDRLPALVEVRSPRYGLALELPTRWLQRDELVFDNGMTASGRASLTAGVRLADESPDLESAAAAFVARELAPEEQAGRISQLELGRLRWAFVGGMLGVAQEVRFVADETPMRVTAHLFSRGNLLYNLIVARPNRLDGYDRVFERILATVRPIEPEFLLEARERVRIEPSRYESWMSLADAERQLGNSRQATEAVESAERLQPGRWEAAARLADLSFQDGLPGEGCRHAAAARRLAPEEPLALLVLAECTISHGDPAAAATMLDLALVARPPEPILRARLERLRATLR